MVSIPTVIIVSQQSLMRVSLLKKRRRELGEEGVHAADELGGHARLRDLYQAQLAQALSADRQLVLDVLGGVLDRSLVSVDVGGWILLRISYMAFLSSSAGMMTTKVVVPSLTSWSQR